MGAWIETFRVQNGVADFGSHPMWVRGLKPYDNAISIGDIKSHPMWVRGLKLLVSGNCKNTIKSHPMWVRGLKPFLQSFCLTESSRTLCGCVD